MSDAVLCTLAKHHLGGHDERGAPARSACRKVIRYEDPPLAPAAVATKAMDAVDRDLAHHVGDGEPFDPVAHAAAMAEAKEALRLPHEVAAEHNHEGFGESTFPLSCPLCVTLLASLAPPAPPARTCSPDCACRTHPADRGCAGCHPDRYHDGEGFVPCLVHRGLTTVGTAAPMGPSCAKRGAIVTAWLGDPPPGWKPGMRPPCIACGAESEEACKSDVPPEPSTADLIGNVLSVEGRRDGLLLAVREARDALDREERRLGDVQPDLEGACSALAKHVGAGKLVLVGGATFKAIAPRKPRGGELAADAMWRLEPVEVAK